MSDVMLGYQELAAAIIKEACVDYLRYLRLLRKNPGDEHCINELERLGTFFRSQWFDTLSTNIDGDRLVHMLQEKERKEAKDGKYTGDQRLKTG